MPAIAGFAPYPLYMDQLLARRAALGFRRVSGLCRAAQTRMLLTDMFKD